MVNNYSFSLNNDVLEHGAIGAHYSKNWTKQKQNEYNHWYYQTHKGETARSKKRVANATAEYNKDRKLNPSNDGYAFTLDAGTGTTTVSIGNTSESAKKLSNERFRHRNAIKKDKSSVANMIAFDISRNVSKATKVISKTLKKIKSKLID